MPFIVFHPSREREKEKREMAVCQNLVPLVNIKIAGKWMFIPLKMVLIGIDPYPYIYTMGGSPTITRGPSTDDVVKEEK